MMYYQTNNNDKGKEGEKAAREYLIENGYKIICNNFRVKEGEIDIIATHSSGVIHFVEVKHRRRLYMLNVSKAQINRIFNASQIYLQKHCEDYLKCLDIGFDLIYVDSKQKVQHIKNAFSFC